jgi:hypothetical protein
MINKLKHLIYTALSKKQAVILKVIIFFCLLTSSFLLKAQAPQGIPYQAIARNASGVAIANTAVKVRFSIRDSIATGAIKYQETHNPTTSALGLFSVNVGMGTVVSGTFSGINWGKNAKFLQLELNTTGGTTYTNLGTTQMMSVPYAMYAGVAGNTTQANSNYMPSADSVLTLVGAGKLSQGSISVPSKETWKIVAIVRPTSNDTLRQLLSSCQSNTSNAFCYYPPPSSLTVVQIGSIKFEQASDLDGVNFEARTVTSCSQCPPFISVPVSSYGSAYPVNLPIWVNSGETISIGPTYIAYFEKYR